MNEERPRSGGDVVGIYANDAALLRLAGMVLLERHEEWSVGRRCLSEISMRLVLTRPPATETLPVQGGLTPGHRPTDPPNATNNSHDNNAHDLTSYTTYHAT